MFHIIASIAILLGIFSLIFTVFYWPLGILCKKGTLGVKIVRVIAALALAFITSYVGIYALLYYYLDEDSYGHMHNDNL
jgi:hypothetical protein